MEQHILSVNWPRLRMWHWRPVMVNVYECLFTANRAVVATKLNQLQRISLPYQSCCFGSQQVYMSSLYGDDVRTNIKSLSLLLGGLVLVTLSFIMSFAAVLVYMPSVTLCVATLQVLKRCGSSHCPYILVPESLVLVFIGPVNNITAVWTDPLLL